MAIEIKPRTIERLRDMLRESGARPSMVLSSAYETLARAGMLAPEEQAAVARIEPLAEVMFLMMAADGKLLDVEKDVIRGAVRGLTDGAVRSGTMKVMLEKFEAELLASSREDRLHELCETLRQDHASAEGAFVLAAAVAFADSEVSDEENALINDLAERLELPDEKANDLLDKLESD